MCTIGWEMACMLNRNDQIGTAPCHRHVHGVVTKTLGCEGD